MACVRPKKTSRTRRIRCSWGCQTYRILTFVVDYFGLDSTLLKEGSILEPYHENLRAASLIITWKPLIMECQGASSRLPTSLPSDRTQNSLIKISHCCSHRAFLSSYLSKNCSNNTQSSLPSRWG